MRFVPALTDAFVQVGLNIETMELQIVFNDGTTKSYGRVTQAEALQLTFGKAPGRYFNENIRKRGCVDVISTLRPSQGTSDPTATQGQPLAEGGARV